MTVRELVNDLKKIYDADIWAFIEGNSLNVSLIFKKVPITARVAVEIGVIDYDLELLIISKIRLEIIPYFLKQTP